MNTPDTIGAADIDEDPDAGEHQLDRALFRRRRSLPTLLRLSFNLGLLAASAVLVVILAPHPLAVAPAIAVGLLQTSFFDVEHWAMHQTLFASRAANTVAGYLAAFVVGLPFNQYRDSHAEHHRFTGDPVRDPELLMGAPTSLPSSAGGRLALVAWSGMSEPWGQLRLMVRLACAPSERHRAASLPWMRAVGYRRLVLECRVLLALYSALVASLVFVEARALVFLPIAVWMHFASMAVSTLPEHAGLRSHAASVPNGRRSRVAFQLAISRTFESNALVRYFSWNGNYHATHHAYPSLPYHAIAAATTALRSKLHHVHDGYAGYFLSGERRMGASTATGGGDGRG